MNLISNRRSAFGFFLLLSLFLMAAAVSAQDKDWRPVSQQELTSKTPVVEADADAEAIFWEIKIDDSSQDDLSLKHYVRVKIFTERGREKYSKFDVPFRKGMKIKDLAARVIKADGSIVEIKKDDIFEREIVKTNGVKIKAKSFAVPNIEPGVIVEYRYKEALEDSTARGMRLQFQRDIPIQKLAYYYKPFNGKEPAYQTYNFSDAKFVKDKDGFWLVAKSNVPALKEEARMPPDDMVRPWMLLTGARLSITGVSALSISYTIKDPNNPRTYWAAVGIEASEYTKFMNKSNGEIKKAAQEITAGAQTPEEKLKKLYDFCQTQIANTTFDPTITEEKRAKLPETKSVGDVLKRKSGSSQFIDMLFGAMANSVGLESRVGLVANRSEMFFDPKMTNEKLLHLGIIGIKLGEDKWKFFNPGMKFLPYGMLTWYEEDTWAFLVGEKDFVWEKTPMTPFEGSNSKRTGKFKLSDDGTLEGDVSLELTGQPAVIYRESNYDETASKREEDLKKEIKDQMSTAEVADVAVENLDDNTKPLLLKYKVKVPNYAQKTGKRLFIQPGYFENGVKPMFSSSERKYDIFFRYPWSENDKVEIAFPANFDMDNADSPPPVADPNNIGALDVSMSVDNAHHVLYYNRKFHFGGGGIVLFKSGAYVPVKNLFDLFNKSDTHTITFKQK